MVVINAINEPVTFVPLTFAFNSHFLTPHRKDKSQMRFLSLQQWVLLRFILRRKCPVFPWQVIISHVVHLFCCFRKLSVCHEVWDFSMNSKIKLCALLSTFILYLYILTVSSCLICVYFIIFETFKEKHLGQNWFLKNSIKSINKQTQDVWTIYFSIYFSPPKTNSRLCFLLRCKILYIRAI